MYFLASITQAYTLVGQSFNLDLALFLLSPCLPIREFAVFNTPKYMSLSNLIYGSLKVTFFFVLSCFQFRHEIKSVSSFAVLASCFCFCVFLVFNLWDIIYSLYAANIYYWYLCIRNDFRCLQYGSKQHKAPFLPSWSLHFSGKQTLNKWICNIMLLKVHEQL